MSPRTTTSTTFPLQADRGRAERIARFKHLTETVLPQLAREGRWPLRLDHCFKRVCLDYAFQDLWYHHLKKPAERHIAGEALDRALTCAEEIAAHGVSVLQQRNHDSLRYRGKLKD